ncbi:unnamed protein product [Closterium sp. NIES-54]
MATAATTTATATAAIAAPACCAPMASLRVLAFDHEGRPNQFDMWLDDQQLYLLSNSKDCVSLFDLASGVATAPPATTDSATRSQWLTCNAAALLAIRNHLPLAECAHFGHHRTAQALYDAVVDRSSSPATTALGRLLLPYPFPELNPPLMFITLYFIVTRLPDSPRSVRDHFLSLDPTSLTVDLLEEHLLAAQTSVVAVGAARGTLRTPLFEGCSPSPLAPSYASAAAADVPARERVAGVVEGAAGVVVGAAVEVVEAVEEVAVDMVAVVGLVAGVGALVAAVEAAVGVAEVAVVGLVAVGLELNLEVSEVASGSSSNVGARPSRPSSFVSGCFNVGRLGVVIAARMSFARVTVLVRHAGGFTLSTAASPALTTLGVLSLVTRSSALSGQICLGLECVPPHPGIAAAALGASESGTLPGTAPAEALHTFTLDSGSSRCFIRDNTTLTPLPAPVPSDWLTPSGAQSLPVPPLSSRVRRSGSTPLLLSPPIALDSFVAPPPGSPLPAAPSWNALPSPCTAATGPGGARTQGTGAAGTGGVGSAGAGDPTESRAARAGGSGAGGAGARGAGVGDTAARGAGAGGAGDVDHGDTVRPRQYFVSLLQQVLSVLSSTSLTPPLLCPPPDQSQPSLQLASPQPAPSPYTEQTSGLT